MKSSIIFLILYFSSAFADIEDLLKPALRKAPSSSMRNIDFIYVINLDERPEKYTETVNSLAPYGIFPYRFSAVNGWKLPMEEVVKLGVTYEPWMPTGWWASYFPENGDKNALHELIGHEGRVYFAYQIALGPIGCILSHLSVLQDAYDSGYETIWVMEDDIEVIQNPDLISDRIDELDQLVGTNGWDVLFTDRDSKNSKGEYVSTIYYAWRPNYTPPHSHRIGLKPEISANLRMIGGRYGSYSMILRRSGIRKLLSFFKCYKIYQPYDVDYSQPANIRLFTVLDDIVSTNIKAQSDNGAPNYSLTSDNK